MKCISFNVNGLRAIVGKNFEEDFKQLDADFFCLQETKCKQDNFDLQFDGYYSYFNYAERKGYSGTAIYTKHEPLNVTYGIGIDEHDTEGRVITLEYDKFFFITVYTPNSGSELKRLEYRMSWEEDFKKLFIRIKQKAKGVVVCGDLNVAHTEIDLKNPKSNMKNAGFTPEEREKFTKLLDAGFIDTFRYYNPDLTGAYSWWSYRFNARKNNAGWRIDYFLVSRDLEEYLESAAIHNEIFGSDHCPVELVLKDNLL